MRYSTGSHRFHYGPKPGIALLKKSNRKSRLIDPSSNGDTPTAFTLVINRLALVDFYKK